MRKRKSALGQKVFSALSEIPEVNFQTPWKDVESKLRNHPELGSLRKLDLLLGWQECVKHNHTQRDFSVSMIETAECKKHSLEFMVSIHYLLEFVNRLSQERLYHDFFIMEGNF